MDNPTNINQISTAPAIPLFFDKVNGGFGIGTGTPQGIAHLIKETYDSQNGINMNVGPISSGHSEATNIVRLASGAMVNLCDTVEFTADDHIDFSFAGNYQGMMGCGDIHFYDVGNGASYYGHFSLRFSGESAETVTLDYGDSGNIFVSDSGTGIRLLKSLSEGPNYNPVFQIKYSNNNYPGELSYNIYLRKLIFS